jgi:hypothetical protein
MDARLREAAIRGHATFLPSWWIRSVRRYLSDPILALSASRAACEMLDSAPVEGQPEDLPLCAAPARPTFVV